MTTALKHRLTLKQLYLIPMIRIINIWADYLSLSTEYEKTTHLPKPTIRAKYSRKKGMYAIIYLCGPLYRDALRCLSIHHCPDKTTAPSWVGTALGGGRRCFSPLPGLKIFPNLLSLLWDPPISSPLPSACPTQCPQLYNLIFLSAGDGGEWIGPPSYKGPSYLLSRVPRGGAGSGTSSGLAGVSEGASALISCQPVSSKLLPLCWLPLPPPIPIWGAYLGVVLPPRKGWWSHPLLWSVCYWGLTWVVASFTATASSLLPQDELVGPYHKR